MNIKAFVQNVSEKESDFVIDNGKIIKSKDEDIQKEIINLMFKVKKNGMTLVENPDIQINKHGNYFLIDLNAENKDIEGRLIAVMLLFEEYNYGKDTFFINLIKKTLDVTIPVTEISDETISFILETLNNSKKKMSTKKILLLLIIILFLIIIFKNIITL